MSSTMIETVSAPPRGTQLRYALFDFDGTLSLLRQGWQTVMAPLMIETLSACPNAEPAANLQHTVNDYIAASTGIQTIHQMIWLAGAVAQRGGSAATPEAYKAIYQERLLAHITARLEAVENGHEPAERYLLPGARSALATLRAAGLTCYLASGTDVDDVRREARLLGVADAFVAIHGAIADWRNYSKARVIADILRSHQVAPLSLVTFGDGYVEIENTRSAGGIAVGVASDEAHPGQLDPWKRERLIAAGAHYIVADLRPIDELLRRIAAGV